MAAAQAAPGGVLTLRIPAALAGRLPVVVPVPRHGEPAS